MKFQYFEEGEHGSSTANSHVDFACIHNIVVRELSQPTELISMQMKYTPNWCYTHNIPFSEITSRATKTITGRIFAWVVRSQINSTWRELP
jgi:hypothetical protein